MDTRMWLIQNMAADLDVTAIALVECSGFFNVQKMHIYFIIIYSFFLFSQLV